MANEIFRNDWHMLSGKQIIDLFDEHFRDVEIQPNITIVTRLRLLEVATLEIMEDRTSSTVYRIRQTDEVFQICNPNLDVFIYSTEGYFNEDPIDDLVKRYVKKDPVFKANSQPDGNILIEHLREPRFSMLFYEGEHNFDSVTWIDTPGNSASDLASLMKKAGAFYKSYKRRGRENI